jgi:OOP family OmpA-OmpF porin
MNHFKKYVLLFLLLWVSKNSAQEKKDFVNTTSKVTNGAVTDTLPKDRKKNYNRWSINLNAGINVGIRPFTTGYYATNPNYISNPDLNHYDFNIRKMFNTKFGIRLGFVYDNFKAETKSPPFNNNMYRASLEGVMNLHRIMKWEEFTDTFGLQFHFGPGFSFLHAPNTKTFSNYDNIFSIVGGTTLLIKVSDRLALNADYTLVSNLTHHVTLDGQTKLDPSLSRTGTVYNTSLGLTLYLGKKKKHADWYWEKNTTKKEYNNLLARIEDLENKIADKGDLTEEVKNYINNNYGDLQNTVNNLNNNFTNVQMKNMINGQYVNVFFDFDETRITPGSISAINFLIKYLNANPQANVDVIGYADELGDFNYNINLSKRRAERVMEMIVRSGIDAKRLKLVVKGEDNSVPKESKLARQLVRRVAFKVSE